MNARALVLAFIFLDFVALTVWAAIGGGPLGAVLTWLLANPWGIQGSFDLIISITIASTWVWRDAKARGINPVPYLMVVPALGSIGLLAYLVRRSLGAPTRAGSTGVVAA